MTNYIDIKPSRISYCGKVFEITAKYVRLCADGTVEQSNDKKAVEKCAVIEDEFEYLTTP